MNDASMIRRVIYEDRRRYGLEWATIASIAGAAVAAAGTGVAVYGQTQAASQAQSAGKYNQQLLKNQAQQEQYAAQTAATIQRARTERVVARQRALTGASGVTAEGSPLLLMMETAAEGELDAQRALYTGQVQADNSLAQATYARWQGGRASAGYTLGAGATLLQGASDIGGRALSDYYRRRRPASLGYGTADPTQAGEGLPY